MAAGEMGISNDNDNNNNFSQGNFSVLLKLDNEIWDSLLPVIIYLGVLIVLGVLGNCLVGYVWWTKMKHSSTNVCVLLLAFFDLLTCLVGIPLDLHDLRTFYTSDSAVMCKVYRFLTNFSVYGSITVLVFIAVLRYVKVCRPLSSFPVKSRGIICISIGTGVGLAWPVLLLHGLDVRPTRLPEVYGRGCGIDESLVRSVYPNIYFSVLGFVFVLACILLTVLYALIAWHIFRRNERRRTGSFGQTHNKKVVVKPANGKKTESRPLSVQSNHRRYSMTTNSLMFFAITLAFVLSFLPSMVMLTIKARRPYIEITLKGWQFAAYMFCFRTYFINNFINPFLYGVWNRRFREESCKLATNCRKSCREDRPENSTTGNPSAEMKADQQAVASPMALRPPSLSSFDKSFDYSTDAKPDYGATENEHTLRVANSAFYMEAESPVEQ